MMNTVLFELGTRLRQRDWHPLLAILALYLTAGAIAPDFAMVGAQ